MTAFFFFVWNISNNLLKILQLICLYIFTITDRRDIIAL
nr:MAG TPA: hypothetical protein [Caudoviricetes sp.]